jgi:hypothetical protein
MGQSWYFNPQWTPVQALNKAISVWNCISQLGQNAQLLCVDMHVMVCGGV